MRVKRASKYGFCAGVRVADLKVRRFAADGGRGAILGALVHNERVVHELEALGLKSVESLDLAEEPAVVFSAHGVPPSAHDRARELGLDVLDTTCTFVAEIHDEVGRALRDGCHLVFVGDAGHREVVGYTHDLGPESFHIVSTMADVRGVDWSVYPKVKVIYQTTLNAHDFEELVQSIEGQNPNTVRADTICYATKENQDAARDLAAATCGRSPRNRRQPTSSRASRTSSRSGSMASPASASPPAPRRRIAPSTRSRPS
jgi:4-hydroxy-3-methylbut-2-enyl diphosphate reductase